jgi:hypothetical protein
MELIHPEDLPADMAHMDQFLLDEQTTMVIESDTFSILSMGQIGPGRFISNLSLNLQFFECKLYSLVHLLEMHQSKGRGVSDQS